ncbi:MAG: transcription termination/antitermination factor NusG [Treponema sp.]|nr:transcription termination/antitermination factor NusG [Treponema sp.]
MSRCWYILHTYTGYEGKIERTIRSLIEKYSVDEKTGINPAVVLDVRVPMEEVVEIKDGKKKTRNNKFLPGYIMLEMDLPEIGWKETCSKLYKIQGVTGFVGNVSRNNRPFPITADEAKNLLQKSGAIKGEKSVHVRQSYNVGDAVKITDGPFASFTGTIKDINLEKEKLSVEVQIFGRPTPVEVNFLQVEKA